MSTTTSHPIESASPRLEVRVVGPDAEPLADADLRRLFPGGGLTQARLDRLRGWPRVTVLDGSQVVGVATCQKTETELRVPEIGMDVDPDLSSHEVLHALLDAIELAGLAGGCRRVVLMPPRGLAWLPARRGYVAITERCAGGWLEKMLG